MPKIHIFHHIRALQAAATFDPTGANIPHPDRWVLVKSRDLLPVDIFNQNELSELESGRAVIRSLEVTERTGGESRARDGSPA